MSTTSSSSSSTTTSSAAASSSAAALTIKVSGNLKIVGVILALTSGVLIGSSFVLKKKGLLRSQAGGELGEGVAYLKSALWWTGMIMMILGEICNFAAYAFVEAIVVTPLGALSVVICAILSSFFLKEKLSFFGWLGCGLCILGSVIIALNGPKEQTIGQIREFQKLFLAPGFLSFIIILILMSLVIIFYFAPRYGKKSMLWYIAVCSMIGGISVSVTTGLGAAIVQTAFGDNQFKYWFMYFLFGFVVITLLVEVYYLNVALALFNTAMVTPTYYVFFTFCTMVTTVVLFQGLKAGAAQIITIVMAFLVICIGITVLQMSKVDPEKLQNLDRRSTILLQAAREHTDTVDEKGAVSVENPGLDTLRGFGTIGSIMRARTVRRLSQSSSRDSELGSRPPGAAAPYVSGDASWLSTDGFGFGGLKRHQLYDAPVPRADDEQSIHSRLVNKRPTITFGEQDLVHSYSRPGTGDGAAKHEHRQAAGLASAATADGYPPLPPLPSETTLTQEGNLLEMDSPELMKKTPKFAQRKSEGWKMKLSLDEETLIVPPSLGTETQVHSAPPTMYAPVRRSSQRNRKDLRDMFDKSNASSVAPTDRTGLLSFASVTDSPPSEWEDEMLKAQSTEESLRDEEKEKEKSREKNKNPSRTPKKYPKSPDDKEETEILWRKTNSLEDDSDGGLPTPEAGSIRLVPTSSKRS